MTYYLELIISVTINHYTTYLVHLSIGAISNYFYKFKYASGILKWNMYIISEIKANKLLTKVNLHL